MRIPGRATRATRHIYRLTHLVSFVDFGMSGWNKKTYGKHPGGRKVQVVMATWDKDGCWGREVRGVWRKAAARSIHFAVCLF